ncbi:MAG: glutaredoxin [Spirochaetes bacterium]|nr:glutaredoxin [Spirochaetota bacterium]MBU0956278.1 glutaredoxin [Spirochaetota bacterium]
MRETLEYTTVEGDKKQPAIVVFSLSTCGFCKRALVFLETNHFAYSYAHLDKITLDQKTAIKKELLDEFGTAVAFPFVIFDGKEALVGFVEEEWKKKLGIA